MAKTKIMCQIKKGDNYLKVQPHEMDELPNLFALVDKERPYYIELSQVLPSRTYSQVKTIHALVKLIWKVLNPDQKRNPTKHEHDDMYIACKMQFADKKKSPLDKDQFIPVSLRDCDVDSACRFIQNLMNLITDSCDLNTGEQMEVRELFHKWTAWRSGLEYDPLDDCTEAEWRATRKFSDASGKPFVDGRPELCHIVPRGADKAHEKCAWNWLALTHEEHMLQHDSWGKFLDKYPHLEGRVRRARGMAGKLDNSQYTT